MASECGCKLDLVIVHASDGPTTDSIINRSECRIADLERQLAEAQQALLREGVERDAANARAEAAERERALDICKTPEWQSVNAERLAMGTKLRQAEKLANLSQDNQERWMKIADLRQVQLEAAERERDRMTEIAAERCDIEKTNAELLWRIAQLEAALREIGDTTNGGMSGEARRVAQAALATPGSGEQGLRTTRTTTHTGDMCTMSQSRSSWWTCDVCGLSGPATGDLEGHHCFPKPDPLAEVPKKDDKHVLLDIGDGPSGIKIYTSEDKAVVDWAQDIPALYLEASVGNAVVHMGPFELSKSLITQLTAALKRYRKRL